MSELRKLAAELRAAYELGYCEALEAAWSILNGEIPWELVDFELFI